jgi:DNA-binding NarL/FixJ family response regulator
MTRHAQPLRLYLVEDSPIMLALLRDLLTSEAAVEVVGQSANAGVAAAEIGTLAPDVAIVDIALESGTGFDVLRSLPAPPHGDRPVVIMLSNYATQRYRDEARRLGADYFFDKNGEIIDMVRTTVSIARGAS